MEGNQIIESIPSKCDETNVNDIQDNLNTSLTSLTLNEKPNEEAQQSELETKKEPNIPTKVITIPLRVLPTHNVPEKIILCLDTGTDADFTPFKIGDGSTYAPLYMLKRVVDIFVQNKNFIDSRHEFALLTLDSKDVRWIKDFTNNPCDIINAMKDISECEASEEFKLSKLLDKIWENVNLPKVTDTLTVVPPYTVRLILLYSRSNCCPVKKESYKELLNNPYFTIDIIMIHEETPVEKYQEIFNCLQNLDDKIYSYKFEVGRNVTMLHDCMAKLLAHPLQRPTQSLATYETSQEKRKIEKED